jgi:MtN3 and saliva related transmembrane protein
MDFTNLIGTIAAFLTTCSFLPQALKTFRTKDVSGISLSMYGIFTVGVLLWLVYGILLMSWPIIIANAITVSLALSIFLMKLRYRR